MSRSLRGSLLGVASVLLVALALLPLRSHIAIATSALVLVIPVALGAATGGWLGGFVSVLAGFLVYDYLFIPPYYTLSVGSAQNWAVLGIYGIVMLVVARLVASLNEAQRHARARVDASRHLIDMTEILLADSPTFGQQLARAVHESFGIAGVSLLQQSDGHLEVVAGAGLPLSEDELSNLRRETKLPVSLSTASSSSPLQTLALVSSGRPIGLLVLRGVPPDPVLREALHLLANHLAIALERSQLQERARRAELLEEVDKLRQALVGAVSHDLRSPLATIKVAASTLVNPGYQLSEDERSQLYELIEMQADRLTRLVNNLLDMTRIEAGAYEVKRQPLELGELIDEAKASLGSTLRGRSVEVSQGDREHLVEADPVLISQVFANLLDNANRHAPPGRPIRIEVEGAPGQAVNVRVVDDGPGVPPSERETVFGTFARFDTGGRSGLGLAISKAFVEAHGGRIWVEEAPGGGASFGFTLAPAKESEKVAP